METLSATRTCQQCGEPLRGRIDQKYCSDMCRTDAHNRKKMEENRQMPESITVIQKTLLHNYKILTMLRKRGERFSLLYLQDLGFSLKHLTGITEQDGILRRHCFNESYLLTDDSMVLLKDQ